MGQPADTTGSDFLEKGGTFAASLSFLAQIEGHAFNDDQSLIARFIHDQSGHEGVIAAGTLIFHDIGKARLAVGFSGGISDSSFRALA